MTVKELIEKLEELPKDINVILMVGSEYSNCKDAYHFNNDVVLE